MSNQLNQYTGKRDLQPEEKARVKIDEMLRRAGWDIVSRGEYSEMNNACAVTEGLLKGLREADYILFAGGKAIGILEAKRAENKLDTAVAEQAQGYSAGVPDWYQTWQKPLPFVFLSNGETLLFRDMRSEEITYTPLKRMYTAKELVAMADIDSEYAALPALPPVGEKGLRQCQYDAVCSIERSFKQKKNRALVSLATGAGKTFTACTLTYRQLTYTRVRRVLFLVDRNNLGRQAEGEFCQYRLTENGDVFNSLYAVCRLKTLEEARSAQVVVSTIQRLFSVLTGQPLFADDEEEEAEQAALFGDDEPEEEIELPDELFLPPDFFDLIIVDECHRSIYGKWQRVLNYFRSAKMVGLTATPTPEAEAFFDRNFASNYTFEDSVRDGVNVPPRIYRIKTKVTESGGQIRSGEKVNKKSKLTGAVREVKEEEQKYTSTQLDRSVINKEQIRTVVRAFKDSIYTALYPDRYPDWHFIPKTLFFAKSDSHADHIIEQIKKVFAVEFPEEKIPDHFVTKITYSAGNTNELIRDFRNKKEFRIAVTVTLVATGTDVKPLECVVFMRDVASAVLYTQMKGRGCRRIGDDILQSVTPNAAGKDCFYIIDAVGVTEHEHMIPGVEGGEGGQPPQPVPSLQRLLELLAHGNVGDDALMLLAGYLAKCLNKGDESDVREWGEIAGISLKDFVGRLTEALQPDSCVSADGRPETASNSLPPYTDINEPNTERKVLISELINNPSARQKILEINAGFIKILLPGEDELTYTGFGKEEAQTYIEAFETYMKDHKDDVEALRIIYNEEKIPITRAMLEDLQAKLLKADAMYKPQYIWQNYKIFKADNSVVPLESKDEREALTNLIQIARYVYGKTGTLVSPVRGYKKGFNLYAGQQQRPLTEEQRQLLEVIARYIVQNGAVTNTEIFDNLGSSYAMGLVQTFKRENVDTELRKLSVFILTDYTKVS